MELNISKRAAWGLSRKQAGGARLTLVRGEVHRLNPLPAGICVIAGCAWVSWNGRDILLKQGECMHFSPSSYDPIISAIGAGTLTFEMLN